MGTDEEPLPVSGRAARAAASGRTARAAAARLAVGCAIGGALATIVSCAAPLAASNAGAPGAAAGTPGAAAAPGPATPGREPRLFLTWRAPEGDPRAVRAVEAPCRAARGHRDTLWLAFDPGRDSTRLLGLTATLAIRPAAGDTLSPHWDFGEGAALKRLRVDFDPDSLPGRARTWPSAGVGGGHYRRTPSLGTLFVVYAVPESAAAVVRGGRTYVFARIILPHPLQETESCGQAVCVAWESGTIAYGYGDEPRVQHGERFVTWNARGDLCAPWRGAAAPAPWTPARATR